MSIFEKSINEYLELVASKSPTPGGGSVSAVVAANGAAMVSMVASLTLGKKGYESVQETVTAVLDQSPQIIADLKILAGRDMEVFEALMTAWRIPAATEAEQACKQQEIQKATQSASEVPLKICEKCVAILKLAHIIAPIGNKNAISDAGVGILLAEAAQQSAVLSIDINLPALKDEEFRTRLITRKALLLTEAADIKIRALAEVKKRLN